MNRLMECVALVVAAFVLMASFTVLPAQAGLGDKLKGKLTKKAEDKTDEVVDGATGEAAESTDSAEADGGPEESAGGANEQVSEVSTKFDFVPGDKVLFYDDFTQDELGEFPTRWNLTLGNFEVAEMKGERWLRCVSVDGTVRLKLPAMETLPEFWTLEFDFYGTEPTSNNLTVRALNPNERASWEAVYPQGSDMAFWTGSTRSSTTLEGVPVSGRHHVMIMARGKALKVYMHRQRMANMPDISAAEGMPSMIEIRLWNSSHPMITNVRFAEGCRPPKDMLAEGKLVTYGIHFDTGSDVVLPDSAPVLRQVAAYLEKNAAVKLKITGHTDNVGATASNLDLSKRRAASVAKVLSEEFKIDAERFATDGKGDTEKVANNANAEGRAMNRRVEFAKM